MSENVRVAPTVRTKLVIDYSDELLEMHLRLPSYLNNEIMTEIRGHLLQVVDLVWGKDR